VVEQMALSSSHHLQEEVNAYLMRYWNSLERDTSPSLKLLKAIQSGLFSGGKRFRPILVLQIAEAIGLNVYTALPFAAALEMVHCYSLIHDDLPCMDDDYLRRGQPTNHILFGESTALLAGDSLLTEAFLLLSEAYQYKPDIGLQLIQLLARCAGERGMAGGQALDLEFSSAFEQVSRTSSQEQLLRIHKLKTGALILAAAVAPTIIHRSSSEERNRIHTFGENLGLAFQLTDDILDYDPNNPERTNIATAIGLDKVRNLLHLATQKASESISFLGSRGSELQKLCLVPGPIS
jgi:geranylgeranyl pyrophosphate synthase